MLKKFSGERMADCNKLTVAYKSFVLHLLWMVVEAFYRFDLPELAEKQKEIHSEFLNLFCEECEEKRR